MPRAGTGWRRPRRASGSCRGWRGCGRSDDAVVVYIADGSRAIARLVTVAQECGLDVREVTLAQPTLDDVFLRATGRHLEVDADVPAPGAGEEEPR